MQVTTLEDSGVQQTGKESIGLRVGVQTVQPQGAKQTTRIGEDSSDDSAHCSPLSRILQEVNDRFGIGEEMTGPFFLTLQDRLRDDPTLRVAYHASPSAQEQALVFTNRLRCHVQEIMDVYFELYKQINDNADFAEGVLAGMRAAYEKQLKEDGKA